MPSNLETAFESGKAQLLINWPVNGFTVRESVKYFQGGLWDLREMIVRF